MIEFRIILYVLSLAIILKEIKADAACLNNDPCLCQINENDKIDISSVLGDASSVNDTFNGITYTFFGCKDKKIDDKEGAGVFFQNKTIISNNSTFSNITEVAEAKDIRFTREEDHYLITFNTTKSSNTPTILLLCDNIKQPFLKILDISAQKMLLSSPNVCIITEHHGMSGGSIFLLILVIFVIIYFVGGALILYFIRGARGAEMIPNVEFWKNLPGLVRDGLIFLLSGCRPNLVTTAETYDRI